MNTCPLRALFDGAAPVTRACSADLSTKLLPFLADPEEGERGGLLPLVLRRRAAANLVRRCLQKAHGRAVVESLARDARSLDAIARTLDRFPMIRGSQERRAHLFPNARIRADSQRSVGRFLADPATLTALAEIVFRVFATSSKKSSEANALTDAFRVSSLTSEVRIGVFNERARAEALL